MNEFVGESVLIVSNQTIADRYAAPLIDMLSGLKVDLHLIPEGEAHKTLGELERIIETCCGPVTRGKPRSSRLAEALWVI